MVFGSRRAGVGVWGAGGGDGDSKDHAKNLWWVTQKMLLSWKASGRETGLERAEVDGGDDCSHQFGVFWLPSAEMHTRHRGGRSVLADSNRQSPAAVSRDPSLGEVQGGEGGPWAQGSLEYPRDWAGTPVLVLLGSPMGLWLCPSTLSGQPWPYVCPPPVSGRHTRAPLFSRCGLY